MVTWDIQPVTKYVLVRTEEDTSANSAEGDTQYFGEFDSMDRAKRASLALQAEETMVVRNAATVSV